MAIDFPKVASGQWKEPTPSDIKADELGTTFPNLHRRYDKDKSVNTVKVGVYEGYNSYRLTTLPDPDASSEIP